MPKTFCEVVHQGKVVGFTPYHSVCDLSGPDIYASAEDACRDAIHGPYDGACRCGRSPESILLVAYYGGIFHWPAKACLLCRVVVEGTDPYQEDKDGEDVGVRKNGHPLGRFQHEV